MISFIQILLIVTALTAISYEVLMTQQIVKTCGDSVLMGFLTGLIMGDVTTGLLIGGTMQLMSLGLAGYGGASVPNYRVGTAVGVAMAIATNGGLEVALVVGIPAATLGVQLDVLAKMFGTVFLHMAERAADNGEYKKSYRIIFWGNLVGSRVALTNTYPALFFLMLGSAFIESLLAVIPAWFISGLSVSGNVLPALGMAILLKYMPIKGNMHYLILGFVLSVYFKLDILPIAIVGGIIAVLVYQKLQKESSNQVNVAGGLGDE
ncbi:MAG: PTS sugar transporter subunit IIC [Erysipelotrichaceae bacterium]|nr:PTS sugar transporter subunit IIC [Erysipelotrichaceae bacterium]